MLILALIGAIIFYVVLFLLLTSTQTPLNTLDAWLRAFDAMLWAPQELVFFILRGVIFVALVYVVADLFFSKAKGINRRYKEKKRDAEEPFALRMKHTPRDR